LSAFGLRTECDRQRRWFRVRVERQADGSFKPDPGGDIFRMVDQNEPLEPSQLAVLVYRVGELVRRRIVCYLDAYRIKHRASEDSLSALRFAEPFSFGLDFRSHESFTRRCVHTTIIAY
jgi:hypothetical protein